MSKYLLVSSSFILLKVCWPNLTSLEAWRHPSYLSAGMSTRCPSKWLRPEKGNDLRISKFILGYKLCNVVNQGVHKLSYSHELPGHRHPSVQLVWHNDHCNEGMACLDSKHNGRYWGHILDGYPHMSNSIALLLLLWSLFKNKNETDLLPAYTLIENFLQQPVPFFIFIIYLLTKIATPQVLRL